MLPEQREQGEQIEREISEEIDYFDDRQWENIWREKMAHEITIRSRDQAVLEVLCQTRASQHLAITSPATSSSSPSSASSQYDSQNISHDTHDTHHVQVDQTSGIILINLIIHDSPDTPGVSREPPQP